MKLNPEDLTVSSFETTGAEAVRGVTVDTIIIIQDPNDPTGNTWCYICPMRTQDNCW